MDDYCRILIVDDEYIMRRGIRYMLNWEEHGFQVVGEASNGKEALDLMEVLTPHIVFCDIAMPVMNGLDFVKVAHRKYPDTRILILSSYDKFEYVREALLNGAVDYILKPTLNPVELAGILNKTVSDLPGIQLKKKSFTSLEQQIERYLKEYNYELKSQEIIEYFPYSYYRILGLPIRLQGNQGQDLSQIIFEKAEQFLKQHAPGKHLKFLHNPEFLCVVFNYQLKDEAHLPDIIEKMIKELGCIHEQAFAVLSTVCQSLAEIKAEFINPEFLSAEIFYHKGIRLYQISEHKKAEQAFKKFDFRRFSNIVSDGNYFEATEMFRNYINKSMECQMQEFKLKNQTKNLLYNLIGSVDRKLQSLEQIRYDYFVKMDSTIYVEDFRDVFEDLIQELLECLGENMDGQDIRLQEILEYIAENYRDELDLSNLAQKFNFNYSYLSTYFNTRMGEGFSEYLNRIRISHACRFLEKREISIAAISDKVGYSEQSYFCRVFKKIIGETPSAYRRGHQSGEL